MVPQRFWTLVFINDIWVRCDTLRVAYIDQALAIQKNREQDILLTDRMCETETTFKDSRIFGWIDGGYCYYCMAIMASLRCWISMGSINVKQLQARDFLSWMYENCNVRQNDQARVLALEVHPATDVADFSYTVVEYKTLNLPIPTEQQNNAMLNHQKWQKI